MSSAPNDQVVDTLNALASLDRDELAKRWTEIFGCPAPHRIYASFLLRALAWHCQLSVQAKEEINENGRLLKKLQRSTASSIVQDSLAPGTRLLREWQGHTHHVTVLAKGFEYNGKAYRSLTAITRQITGTPWSGPQFFGLRT